MTTTDDRPYRSAPSRPPGDMRIGTHNGNLMVAALKRHHDKPVMYLGDTTLTGGETAEQMSRYVQAFEALGAGTGTHGALLALNRPEVLYILGSGQTQGYRRTSLHPLGSADDHAYVINDAGITFLIIDPVLRRPGGRAAGEVPGADPGADHRPGPRGARPRGRRPGRQAAEYDAAPLIAALLPPDHIVSITYTGGTTGKPKGVIGTSAAMSTMTQIQLAEWEWPENPKFLMCTPLSHAGAAFFVPTVIKGGTLHVLSASTRPRCSGSSRSRRSPPRCWCPRCSTR